MKKKNMTEYDTPFPIMPQQPHIESLAPPPGRDEASVWDHMVYDTSTKWPPRSRETVKLQLAVTTRQMQVLANVNRALLPPNHSY